MRIKEYPFEVRSAAEVPVDQNHAVRYWRAVFAACDSLPPGKSLFFRHPVPEGEPDTWCPSTRELTKMRNSIATQLRRYRPRDGWLLLRDEAGMGVYVYREKDIEAVVKEFEEEPDEEGPNEDGEFGASVAEAAAGHSPETALTGDSSQDISDIGSASHADMKAADVEVATISDPPTTVIAEDAWATVELEQAPGKPDRWRMKREANICPRCGLVKQSIYHQTQCEAGPKKPSDYRKRITVIPVRAAPEPPVAVASTQCTCASLLAGRGEPGDWHHGACPLHRHRWIIATTTVDGVWPSKCKTCPATKGHPVEPQAQEYGRKPLAET